MQSGNWKRWTILQHVVLLPGFTLQQFRRIHLRKKKILTVRNYRPVHLHILSVTSFTSGMWIRYFFRAIYIKQCKRLPLLFSGPKDINDFSHFFLMKNPPPLPPCPLRVSNLCSSLSTNKGMNYKRCLFARFFFITINFIIIQTLLVKTTRN